MLQRCNLEAIPDDTGFEALFAFLLRLVWEAARGASVIPVRFQLPAIDEISLVMDGKEEVSMRLEESEDSLSFDVGDDALSIS